MLKFLAISTLILLASCGDSSGPIPNITGIWVANWGPMSIPGTTCTMTGMQLTLHQSGDTFTGQYSSAGYYCNGGVVRGIQGGIIVNGTIRGNAVSFDLGALDLHQTGTISSNSMSGAATWQIDIDGGSPPTTETLNGNWAAAR